MSMFWVYYLLVGFLLVAVELTFSSDARVKLLTAKQYNLHPMLIVTLAAVLWPPLAALWAWRKLTK